MGGLTVRAARMADALAFGGSTPLLRKALLFQVRHCPSLMILYAGQPVMLAMFWPHTPRRIEVALRFQPAVTGCLRAVVRFARLTFRRQVQDGRMIMVRIRETDSRAQGWARHVGFVQGRTYRDLWFFKG